MAVAYGLHLERDFELRYSGEALEGKLLGHSLSGLFLETVGSYIYQLRGGGGGSVLSLIHI